MTPRVAAMLLAAWVVSAPLQAQPGAGDRHRVSASALGITAGDDRCDDHGGLGVGAEVRTRGRWVALAGADLLAGWAMSCSDEGRTAIHNGQEVEVFTDAGLDLSPRIRGEVGRSLRVGGLEAELTGGLGFLYLSGDVHGAFLATWYGATLRLGADRLPVTLELECGVRQVPVRYVMDRRVVHEFGQQEPLLRVGVAF